VERQAFIWLGGLIDYKGPLDYVRLAELVPEARFWMVATRRGSEWDALADEVSAAADRLPNLELLPPRGREQLFELYDKAIAVVNTSAFEGFPNTFMEGWSSGAAALSLNVDPDGVIERHDLGFAANGDMAALADAASGLWERRLALDDVSATTRRYIAEHHDPAVIGEAWELLVERLGGAHR
jgi:glycosyltransferase involved in cell wall biosynthesis